MEELQKNIEQQQQQQQQVESSASSASAASFAQLRAENDALEQRLGDASARIGELNGVVDAMLNDKEARVAQLQRVVDDLRDARRRVDQLDAEKKQLGVLLAAARVAESTSLDAADGLRSQLASSAAMTSALETQLAALQHAAAGVTADAELTTSALRCDNMFFFKK